MRFDGIGTRATLLAVCGMIIAWKGTTQRFIACNHPRVMSLLPVLTKMSFFEQSFCEVGAEEFDGIARSCASSRSCSGHVLVQRTSCACEFHYPCPIE